MSMGGGPARSTDAHLQRIYTRIDELATRVSRLERALWIGSGALGTVAVFNLLSNLSQMASQ